MEKSDLQNFLFNPYIIFIIICILNIHVYSRYKARKNEITLFLLKAFIFFSLSPIFQSFDLFFLDALSKEYLGYIASFGYSIAYVFSAIGNYFLIHFTYGVFNQRQSKMPKLLGIGDIFCSVLFLIFWTQKGHTIGALFILIHAIFSFLIFSLIIYYSFKTISTVETMLNRRAFQMIGLSGILWICMYLSFIGEVIINPGHYSIFGSIGWIFGLLGVIFSYLGFVIPNWIRKLIEAHNNSVE